MSEIFGNLEKRLLDTREKIRTTRREITGGTVEDKLKELGKKTYDELDKDLDALQQTVIEGKGKAKEGTIKLYNELEEDITAARTKLHDKRMEITGGVAEEKAKEAAHVIKEKSSAALKDIEDDIDKLWAKIKNLTKDE